MGWLSNAGFAALIAGGVTAALPIAKVTGDFPVVGALSPGLQFGLGALAAAAGAAAITADSVGASTSKPAAKK